MVEANQFTWTHRELVTQMIKMADIHDGRWFLLINFGMAPGNFGPTPDQVSPGIAAIVVSVGIQRVLPDSPLPDSLTVDAAKVNPAARAEKPRKKKS